MRQSDTHNLPTIPLTLVDVWPIHNGPIQQHTGRASAAQGIASSVCYSLSRLTALSVPKSLYFLKGPGFIWNGCQDPANALELAEGAGDKTHHS